MLRVMTDEESVASADEQIDKIAKAMAATMSRFPDVPIEALRQMLWMVNGPNWISGTDMARACIAAKRMRELG